MKKSSLAFTAIAIFVLSFLNLNAQKSAYPIAAAAIKNLKAYADIEGETKIDKSALYKINFKAVRNFKNTYPGISNETWEVPKDGYVARFVSNSVRTLNYYDKNGRWLYTVQLYNEAKLPKNVRAAVKISYYDYLITSVQEININRNNPEPIYLVHLKPDDQHKTIRVCQDEMEEVIL